MNIKSQGAQLMLLTIAASAGAYARTSLSPLQETLQRSLALTDNQISLIQGLALAAPLVLASVPLGLIVDRYSRARVLLIAAALNVLGGVFVALASGFPGLFLARCFVGLMAPAAAITAVSMIADLFGPDQRGRAYMVVSVGQVGGMSAAFAVGGALLTGYGTDDPQAWRWAMLWLTAPLVVVALLMLATREPERMGVVVAKPNPRIALAELWQYRKVVMPILAGGVMVGMADSAVLVWAVPALARGFVLEPAEVGAIMAAALLVAGIGGPIVGGFIADLCQRAGGPTRTIAAMGGLALLSVLAGFFPITPTVGLAGVLLAVFLLLGYAIAVMKAALLTVVVPNELRGLCMAVATAIGVATGFGLAPILVSQLANLLGGPAMIGKALAAICVAISLFGVALFALGRRYVAANRPSFALP